MLVFLSAVLLGAGAAATAAYVLEQQRLRRRRRWAWKLFKLSRDILAASSPVEIAERMEDSLPSVIRASQVTLYLYNRRTRCLERVLTKVDPQPIAAPIDEPPEGLANAAAACFQHGRLLNIPDVLRNPVTAGPKSNLPQSAMFVRLGSNADAVGVLEIADHHLLGYFSLDEENTARHLAHQAVVALKLQMQAEHSSEGSAAASPPGESDPTNRRQKRVCSQVLTWLLVEPDKTSERQLLDLLASRGHRVVPTRPGEAVDIAHRLRFDAAIWGVRPGGGWNDFRERVRASVPAFIQVGSLAGNGGAGFVLARPVAESALERIILELEARAGQVGNLQRVV